MSFDVSRIRADFPILSRQVNNKPLVYLDNGASAQKPQVVIDAITQAYASEYANVHRGLHYLSNLATDKYEAVRGKLARFLNAASEDHISPQLGHHRRHQSGGLWLGNAALCRRAMKSYCRLWSITPILSRGIFCARRMGVKLTWVDVDVNGDLDPEAVICRHWTKDKTGGYYPDVECLGNGGRCKNHHQGPSTRRCGFGGWIPSGGPYAGRRAGYRL